MSILTTAKLNLLTGCRDLRGGHDALNTSRGFYSVAIFVGDDVQLCASLKQFTGFEQKVRPGRFANFFMAQCKGLVNQDALWLQAFQNAWHQRAPQIMGHDDGIKASTFQRPRAAFYVSFYHLTVGLGQSQSFG